jgi:16S rRNA (guanine966-N2)-methyltransferase
MAIRNSVRIIGGAWRGRRVSFPDLDGLRPTPDRVRETLFNWLQNDIARSRCLDLFAGSGALGLEALSRGAKEVVFIEQSPAAAQSIRAHLSLFGGNGVVIETDVARYLAPMKQTPPGTAAPGATAPDATAPDATAPDPFDLVFLDPPFGQDWLPRILPKLRSGAWIVPGGLVYLECERSLGAPTLPEGWAMLRSKSAGEVGYHLARVSTQAIQ